MELKDFGTKAWPIHPSGMRPLIRCPWESAMRMFTAVSDESGQAADTGSAMHAAADALHKGREVADALSVMKARIGEYPQADMVDAAHLFLMYAKDPRNVGAAIVASEEKITFQIACHPEDKTQAPIEVIGTGDQVRAYCNELWYWDIKTSKKDPEWVLNQSCFQAAAYCIGLSMKLGQKVNPGGIILPRRYRADGTGPVFLKFRWTFDDIEELMLPVRKRVAEVRNGDLYHVPHAECHWCGFQSPDACRPALQELKLRTRS
jgi:hypothetical protein